jgi:HK97 family phage major capsid protein
MDKNELQKLLDKRASVYKQMKDMLEKADEKTWNAENKAKYEKMEADFEALSSQIKASQKIMDFESELNKPLNNPITGNVANEVKHNEYKMAFEAFIKGQSLTPDFRAALNTGTGEDGGYLVPVEFQKTIIKKLYEFSNTRKISNVISTKATRNIPVESTPAAFDWIDESGTYGGTSPKVTQSQLAAWKVGGIIKVSEEFLQDTFVNFEEYISRQIAIGIAKAEGPAFALGDGVKKPTGYATGLTAGVTLASKDSVTSDEVIDTFYSLTTPYREKATWRMNDQVEKAIRKLKDSDGRYIFAPALLVGERDTLLGKAIVEDYNLPTLGNNSKKVLALGDFSYYTIADRGQISIQKLVERYADEGMVGFKVNKRVDAKRALDEAFTVAVTPDA